MESRKLRMEPTVALLPDGSSRSIYCTDLPRAGDMDALGNLITLPKGTILIPFNGAKFMEIPTYEEAKKKKIGHMRTF